MRTNDGVVKRLVNELKEYEPQEVEVYNEVTKQDETIRIFLVLENDWNRLMKQLEYWNTNFYIKEQLSLHLDKELELRKKYESFLKSVIRSGEPFDESKTFKWFSRMEEIL